MAFGTLTTSSASILIPSSNISPRHSFKTWDITSSMKEITDRCSLNLNHDPLVEFFPPLCRGGEWSVIHRVHDGALILAAIKLTCLFTNELTWLTRHLCQCLIMSPYHTCQRTPQSDSHYSHHSRHLQQSPIHPSTQMTKPPPAARDLTAVWPTCLTYMSDLRVWPTCPTYVANLRISNCRTTLFI